MQRNTQQNLIPENKQGRKDSSYDIYPTYPVSQGKIESGYQTIVAELKTKKLILLDGYGTNLIYATAQLLTRGTDPANSFYVFFRPEGVEAEFLLQICRV